MGVITFRRDPRIAEKERAELRLFASQAGQNIYALVKRLGLHVDFEDFVDFDGFDDEVSAVLIRSPKCGSKSGYRIAVNRNHSPERQRWSIAHEIGHYVLHRNDPNFEVVTDEQEYGAIVPLYPVKGNSFRNGSKSRIEREAEEFSAALLIPIHLVRASWSFRSRNIPKLSREFYVSEKAMRKRLEEIEALAKITRRAAPSRAGEAAPLLVA